MERLLAFDDPGATDVARSGGKGASLAKLSAGGFSVPPGVIVTSEAYREWIAGDAGLARLASRLDFGDHEALRAGCAAIRQHLLSRPLPDSLLEALQVKLVPIVTAGNVAVRSSSTMEDLAGAAFAGQHDTYLGISGIEEAIDAVRRCFSSLWEDRAASYRHERGFDHAKASMAVVIQRMVSAESAGVAFTMNPITGSLDEIVINAAWGLGETVVSGEGGVDQFVVSKRTGAVVQSSIAEKQHALFAVGRGTEKVELDRERALEPSLTPLQIEELVALSSRVEAFYGFPQDTEWAFAGGALWLLQSRPVTKFPARWTRQESAERFPNVITPLTWDFVREGFHASLEHSLALMGLPPFDGAWFERFDDYIYGNETAVRLFTSWRRVEFASLDELRAMVPMLREQYAWALHLPVRWARDLDRYLLGLGEMRSVDIARLDDCALWEQLLRIHRAGSDYFLPNIAISITQGILHRTLFRLVALVAGPADAPALYDGLTCFCETKTNLVNQELRELARIVSDDSALHALLESGDRRKLWESGRLEEHPGFLARFRRFIEDHGHREVDFDSYEPTWNGQPWVVLENVRLLAMQTHDQDSLERDLELRQRQQAAERRFHDLVPGDLRAFAAEIVRLARTYTALDDLEHYQTTRLSVPFRAAIVELGRRMMPRAGFAEPEDVFFLRRETLRGWVERAVTNDEVAREARENKASWERNRASAPPWSRDGADAVGEEPEGDAMRGLPGSPGVAEGVVYVVRGPEDFAGFPRGAVLVARTTNPAWTPLFPIACAVVTESGGPLSHGAVTAREVGIPAVMAVRGVLSRLATGSRVRVNGTAGEVRALDG